MTIYFTNGSQISQSSSEVYFSAFGLDIEELAMGFSVSYDNNQNPYTGTSPIPFNTVYYNHTGGQYSTSTGLFTAPITGDYFFHILLMSANDASYENKYYSLCRNGVNGSDASYTQRCYSTNFGAYHKNWPGFTLFRLVAGDTVGVYPISVGLYMNSTYYTRFSGCLVSAA
jgi:hypothetical protein